MDLDDDELKATRKAKGLEKKDDESFMNIEEAIKSLKEYIEQDCIYTVYKKNKPKIENDFDMYCIKHCQAIEALLNELKLNKRDLEIVDKECSRLEQVELEQLKTISKLTDKLKEYEGN